MTRRNAAIAAALAAVALAGCGSSNKQLSYSDYIAKANKICSDGNRATSKQHSIQDAGKALEPFVKKFKDLNPPDKLKPIHDQFVAASQQLIEKAKAGDTAGANALSTKTNRLGSQLGAAQCSG